MPFRSIDLTLASDTNILADGDVISTATSAIIDAVQGGGRQACMLRSLTLYDANDQGIALDLVFMRSSQSLGAANSAPDVDDTEALEIIGTLRIATTDYIDVGANQIATMKNINLVLSAGAGASIFVAAITRGGTPTYTAGGLRLRLGIEE